MIAVVMALAAALAIESAGPDEHFAPNALYGHINGGAELVLEYGFAGLDIEHVRAGGVEIDVESYHMTDAAAALGLYLSRCGQERPWPEVAARSSGSDDQLIAVEGSLFLLVRNPTGDPAGRAAMAQLACEALAAAPAAAPLAIWDHLPADGRLAGTEFLFRGRFALDPVFTFGDGDVLQVEGRALGAGARYADAASGEFTRMVVQYADADTARAALAHLASHLDPYLTVVTRAKDRLVLRDHAGKYAVVQVTEQRLDLAVHLDAVP